MWCSWSHSTSCHYLYVLKLIVYLPARFGALPPRVPDGCAENIIFDIPGFAAFETGNGVTLDGFLTPIFNVDDYIRITNTTSNNGTFRIVATNYSFVTDKTVLELAEPTIFEVDATTTIESYRYLSGDFHITTSYTTNNELWYVGLGLHNCVVL